MRVRLLFAGLLMFLPTFAFARLQHEAVAHVRSQMIHDRAPKVHDRGPQARRG